VSFNPCGGGTILARVEFTS